jgi:glutamate-5-semialdehyde dehydrogenase
MTAGTAAQPMPMPPAAGTAAQPMTAGTAALRAEVRSAAERARVAARTLATLSRATKDAALVSMADALIAGQDRILEANSVDVSTAIAAGTPAALLDRLSLTSARVAAMAAAIRDVADLADPIGDVMRGATLANGLRMRQVRVPLGVVGIIYEARPNVTVDAAALCLKSGNAALLRGSSSAANSNRVLVDLLRGAVVTVGLPADVIQLVPGDSHDVIDHLMQARGLIDVLIPRGGAELIQRVVLGSQVPVIETGVGNCHVYVDESADIDMAIGIIVNSKTQRVSVCNTAETMLVHRGIADAFLPRALKALAANAVHIHGDDRVAVLADRTVEFTPAHELDWVTEYLSLDLAVHVVDSLDAAIDHIRRYGTAHTEAIVTSSLPAAERFVAEIDAAAVIVNASTRFTDGGEFGFGAEIGISTQKLHARGPMGLQELTSTKYIVTGEGQVRS